MTILTIIIFLLIFSLLVIVHELGHFLAAKFFGVGVSEFGIGIPPKIMKIGRFWQTDFVINALPFGGYCSLIGQEQDQQMPTKKKDLKQYFYTHPAWQRFIIVLAGPVMNLLLAWVIMMVLLYQTGIPQIDEQAVYIQAVVDNSPAQQAGLIADSKIISLHADNGQQIQPQNAQQVIAFLSEHAGEYIHFHTQSNCLSGKCTGEFRDSFVYVREPSQQPSNQGATGIVLSSLQFYFYPWYQHLPLSIIHGSKQALFLGKTMLSGIVQALGQLFGYQHGNSEIRVMGTVGIVGELSKEQIFLTGLSTVFQFMALFSLNLGLINLLPIPAVDGGHLLLIILEKFFGRLKIARIEKAVNYVGVLFLIALTILITGNDIWHLLNT